MQDQHNFDKSHFTCAGFPGEIMLRLLKMLVLPLVAGSMIAGVTQQPWLALPMQVNCCAIILNPSAMSFPYSTSNLHRHFLGRPCLSAGQSVMSCVFENRLAMVSHVNPLPPSSQSRLLCLQVLLRKAKKMTKLQKGCCASIKHDSGSVVRYCMQECARCEAQPAAWQKLPDGR